MTSTGTLEKCILPPFGTVGRAGGNQKNAATNYLLPPLPPLPPIDKIIGKGGRGGGGKKVLEQVVVVVAVVERPC
jgi:hypothetical protein